MPNRYRELSPGQAERLLHDTIAAIVREELLAASRLDAEGWQDRDIPYWADSTAGVVRTAIENHRLGTTCGSQRAP